MKKYFRLNVLLLVLGAVLFCSCKDKKKSGDPNPIIGVKVLSDTTARVTIDQKNKRIDVLYYKYDPLTAVTLKFDLTPGSSMYTPLMKNPATLDLSSTFGSTIIVQTGDDKVSYNVYGAVDYPIMGMVATADNGEIVGRVVFNQNAKEITVEFNNIVDVTKIRCSFQVSPEGGQMIQPADTVAILDMTNDQTLQAKSNRAGEVTYKLFKAESADVSICPPGWTKVTTGYTMAKYMALYKTEDLHGNRAFALIADKRAKFEAFSKGISDKKTMPEFYQLYPVPGMINGSAEDHVIVVNGQVVNEGTPANPIAFGVTKTGYVLIGDNWKVKYNEVKFGDSVAYNAIYATTFLINKGTKKAGLPTDPNACSGIGVTSRGYYVFLVAEKWNSPGISLQQLCDIMAEWKSFNAVALEGGTGSGLLVGGQPTISSTKGPDFFKQLGCVGVLK